MSQRILAAAQSVPMRGDVVANVTQHVRLVQLAAREKAQVVVFPELSLTGYEIDLARDLAFSLKDRRLAPLLDAAAAYKVTMIAGAPVKLGTRLVIGALILKPDKSVDLYTKHRLGAFGESARVDGDVPPAEATVFAAGTLNPALAVGGSPAAVAVCADTGRPAHASAAAKRGAKNYLASMFVIPSELERDQSNLKSYATEHAMAVVMANFGGPSGGLKSGGRSAIWSERGELVAQLEASGAGLVIGTETGGTWSGKTITA